MGWGLGKLKKAVGGVLNAIPVVSNIAKISPIYASGMRSAIRQEKNLLKQSLVNESQQAQIARLEQEKAIASESARLQEEQARKRTLFAGTTLGDNSERKKLLGL